MAVKSGATTEQASLARCVAACAVVAVSVLAFAPAPARAREDPRAERARQIRDQILEKRARFVRPEPPKREEPKPVDPYEEAVTAARARVAELDAKIDGSRKRGEALAAPRDTLLRKSEELAAATATLEAANRARVEALYRSARLGTGVAGWHPGDAESRRLARYLASVSKAQHEVLTKAENERAGALAALERARSDEAVVSAELQALETQRVEAQAALDRAVEEASSPGVAAEPVLEASAPDAAEQARAGDEPFDEDADGVEPLEDGAANDAAEDEAAVEEETAIEDEAAADAREAMRRAEDERAERAMAEAVARLRGQAPPAAGTAPVELSAAAREAAAIPPDGRSRTTAQAQAQQKLLDDKIAAARRALDERKAAQRSGEAAAPATEVPAAPKDAPVPDATPRDAPGPSAPAEAAASASPAETRYGPSGTPPPAAASAATDVAAKAGAPEAAPANEDVVNRDLEEGPAVLAPSGQAAVASSTPPEPAAEAPKKGLLSRLFQGGADADKFAAAKGKLRPPVAGKVVAAYGQQHKSGATYRGVILRAQHDAPIQSVAPGRVSFVGNVPGLGNTVIVSHGDRYHTVYARLGAVKVKEGEQVGGGTEVGDLPGDNSDMHFELRDNGKPIDPLPWLKDRIPGAAP